MQHSLIYFPDYTSANPYQACLYTHIDGDFHVRPGSIVDAHEDLRSAHWARHTIFHLHWEDAAYRQLSSMDGALAECQAFLNRLEQFVDDGGLFLWTIHNLEPHDGRYPAVHRALCEKLMKLVHQVHLHSYTAVAELERDRRLDRRKVVVIPHGNYCPVYRPAALPAAWSSAATSDTARRFLLFGRLGRYKGGELLVRAFAALNDVRTELMIIGKQIDPIDLTDLPPSVAGRITVLNRFLAEEEVPRLMAATDFVVAPYLASLTSGTILLAMTLGQPVIAPRFPTLQDLIIDGENGFLFEPRNETSLREALRRACQLDNEAMRRLRLMAKATARRYDWRIIGNQFSGLLHRLVARPRPRRALPARTASVD